MSEQFPAGTRVRIKTDPGRVGVATGLVRERAGTRLYQVTFAEGAQYVPASYLEPIAEGGDDPLDLLHRGRFAHPPDLRRTLTYARLAGRLADVIYSMETTDTDFYAYQFKPLVKLLNSATTGMLIADEVGLGKTIEAGLIWTEMRSRFDYERLLVLCPAMLRSKWKKELHRRFGVEASIVDAKEMLEVLEHSATDPDHSRFALIGSLQGIRPRHGWKAEDENRDGHSSRLARFLDARIMGEEIIDLAIIDEAHYLRNAETATAQLGVLVRRSAKHIVLLSATPVHLRSTDLYNLVKLADPDTFDRASAFDDILASNEPLVSASGALARGTATKDEIRDLLRIAQDMPLLRKNQQVAALLADLENNPDLSDPRVAAEFAYRIETANLLGHVVTRTRRREVEDLRVVREPFAEAVPMTDVERAFYNAVTDVVRTYCARADTLEGFLLVMPQRQISSSMPAAFKAWSERQPAFRETAEEDLDDWDVVDQAEEQLGPLVTELVKRVSTLGDYDSLVRNDSKYKRLQEKLKKLFTDDPLAKVVLFSYFKPTLAYLKSRLMTDGISVALLHGDTDNKDAVVQDFRDAREGMVLLSSEVASEGIDLQFAWAMVNYDLPWNPMRVEQRIGRIDRLGQEAQKIVIWNMFYKGTIDDRIYNRLYQRLGLFERTIGGLEPILGKEIRDLAMELFQKELTPEQEEERITLTEKALERRRQEEERLESEAANLVAHGDYILRQVNAARQIGRLIVGDDLRWYVVEFFNRFYPGCEFVQTSDNLDFDVTLSNEARDDLDRFLTAYKLRAQTKLAGVNADRVPCRFENLVVSGGGARREVISHFHPLVRFVSESIRKRVDELVRPAVAIQLANRHAIAGIAPGLYVFTIQRWTMKGLQDSEYLHYSAAPLLGNEASLPYESAENLIAAAALHGRDWLTADRDIDVERGYYVANEYCLAESDAAYEKRCAELRARNDDRAAVQEAILKKRVESAIEQSRERIGKNPSLRHMEEGKIRKNTETYERQMRRIAERKRLKPDKQDICVGIIRVMD